MSATVTKPTRATRQRVAVPGPERAEIAEASQAFARAALGAAGHEVTDPHAVELLRRQARGEISGDDARAEMVRRILGQ